MLYMQNRVRMTFRIEPELADILRHLPNQTRFVEAALKEALGQYCPLCGGGGRLIGGSLRVSDFKAESLPRLDRAAAGHLKGLVRFGRRMLATDLELEFHPGEGELEFRVARDETTLLGGRLSTTGGGLHLN
jgi:hypothetical protein